MTTIRWTPNLTNFNPTASDNVVFVKGTGSFSSLTLHSAKVTGGSDITIGDIDMTGILTVTNGGSFTLTGRSAQDIQGISITKSSNATFDSPITVHTISIDNTGNTVFNDGLTVLTSLSRVVGGGTVTINGPLVVNGKTITQTGDISSLFPNSQSSGTHIVHNSAAVPCYLKGTKITVVENDRFEDVDVETLKIGDRIACNDDPAGLRTDKFATVLWVGRGTTRVVDHDAPGDLAGYPVRIVRDAFDDACPSHDLLVTAEHCVFIDRNLIPVRMLINDRTIYYDRAITDYEYFHFITDRHMVVRANGASAESMLPAGHDRLLAACGLALPATATNPAYPLCTNSEYIRCLSTDFDDMRPDLRRQHRPGKVYKGHNLTIRSMDASHASQDIGQPVPVTSEILIFDCDAARPCDLFGPAVDDRRMLSIRVALTFRNALGNALDHQLPLGADGWSTDGWMGEQAIVRAPRDAVVMHVEIVAAMPVAREMELA